MNQTVWVRNFRDAPRWLQRVVIDRVGPLSYLVRLSDGNVWRRHIDHLRDSQEVTQSPRHGDDQPQPPDLESVAIEDLQPMPLKEASDTIESRGSIIEQNTDRINGQLNRTTADSESAHPNVEENPPRRYPKRVRKCPDRLYGTLPKEH